MDVARWREVEALFHQTRTLSPAARQRLLDKACRDHPSLRRQVETLLTADDQAGAFLEDHALLGNPAPPSGWSHAVEDALEDALGDALAGVARSAGGPPTRVGPYRLLREIGRGGMGTVYLAERDDQTIHRRVALKLVRRELDADHLTARFLAERQALADLEHPHIARLYTAGLTTAESPAGSARPYFAMEYVPGLAITAYCRRHGLSVRARVALFLQACEAVHYAHTRLVLHRDLKPSNILVTDSTHAGDDAADGDAQPNDPSQDASQGASRDTPQGAPQVKLVDFGLARSLSDEGHVQPLTATHLRMFTPQYASPEQVCGGVLTTASDVYALGVVLYELLTGRLPYAVEATTMHAIERAVLEALPEPPSAAVMRNGGVRSTERRESDGTDGGVAQLRQLRRALRGELDAIVLKALEKRPEDRYASAEALRMDLARYLAGEPLLAQRATWRYPLRRLARRVRPALKHIAALTIVALLMAVGLLAYGPLDKDPASVRLEGETLVVENAAGQSLDEILIAGGRMADRGPLGHPARYVALVDIDGDGLRDLVYSHSYSTVSSEPSFIAAKHVGADTLLWKLPLVFDLPLERADDRTDHHYGPVRLLGGDYDNDGRPEVYASVASNSYFLGVVLKLDAATGTIRDRYLHPGVLTDMGMTDLDGDGASELFLGGSNNAFGKDAVLAVLDPHRVEGHGPFRAGYEISQASPAHHEAYLRFPPSVMREVLLQPYSLLEWLDPFQGVRAVQVVIREANYRSPATSTPLHAHIFLDIGLGYRVRDLNTSDAYDVIAAKLHRDGHLEAIPDAAYWEDWASRIQYWTGDGWISAEEWAARTHATD